VNISELHVDDFGAWHDLTLGELGKHATVFYGPNEAGKTTLLNLIRTVLYGFSEKRCNRYLPPARGHEAGGSLTVSDIAGEYTLHRSAPSHYRGGDGTFRVSSKRGGRHGKELLTTLLAGVDETIFNNVFAVGLTQMQQLATLSDTEAANQLYGLATGVDRVSLMDVTRTLEQYREQLLPGSGQSQRQNKQDAKLAAAGLRSKPLDVNTGEGVVDRLLEQKGRLERELKALRRDEGHFGKLRREYRSLTGKIAEREKARRLLDGNGDWNEISKEIRARWNRCKQINSRLHRVGPIVEIPGHIQKRIASLQANIRQRRAEWEKLRDQRRKLKARASRLRGSDSLYAHAAEIEAIDRQRGRLATVEEDAKRAQATVDELEFELQAEMEELGLQTGTSAKRLPAISDEVIDALRVPAREARELRESVEALKKLAESRRKEAESVKVKLEAAAVRFGGEDIHTLLQRNMAIVQGLERRLDLDEEREGLVRRLDEVQDEARYWQGRGILPWNGVLTVCGVFSGGAALLMTGLLNDWFMLSDSVRMPMMLIGGSLAVVSLVMKNAFESSAQERADFFTQQLTLLQDEQMQAIEETETLDDKLPGSGHYDQRLIDAREKLSELQQFMPLTQQYERLTREAEAADYQATSAVRQLKDARLGWKASLRAVGLPDTLTPTQVGAMSGRVSGVTQLRKRIAEAKRELEERRQEFESIRQRVAELLVIGEIIDVPESLNAQLSRLTSELEKHSRSGRERETLRQQWHELGEKQRRISGAAKVLYRHRRQLLEAHGISNPAEFRATQKRALAAAKLRAERDRILHQISELAGELFPLAKLQKMLDRRSNALLEQLSRIDQDRKSLEEELRELRARADQLKVKLDSRMQDRRGDQKELAIRVIDEKIRQASERWQRAATVSAVLDSVKQNYETKRQPVALAEASRHLERLTEKRYTRIWTPMGQSALCIDDAHGTALPVEKLSRGTRELVFLALRLALVSSYNRRGANMPVVLDDVFVNFDDHRARAAASVLADIAASGQQMLIFTCHERIRDIFGGLGADVRNLPVRSGIAKRAESKPAVSEPPPPVVTPPETEVVVIASELPVYDAESWDEAVEQLAIPLPPKQAEKQPAEKKPDSIAKRTGKEGGALGSEASVRKKTDETSLSASSRKSAAKSATTSATTQSEPTQVQSSDAQSPVVSESPPPRPTPVVPSTIDKPALDPALDPVLDPALQIEPAWRDEWLEPLPDMADNDSIEDFFDDPI